MRVSVVVARVVRAMVQLNDEDLVVNVGCGVADDSGSSDLSQLRYLQVNLMYKFQVIQVKSIFQQNERESRPREATRRVLWSNQE